MSETFDKSLYFLHGTLISVINKQTGKPHHDWRDAYTGKSGNIFICPSDETGKHNLFLYPGSTEYLRTSRGDLTINDTRLEINTQNSIYTFAIDEEV